MFELIFIMLFIAFMVVSLMLFKKVKAHFDKVEELKHKELIALVNIDEDIKQLIHSVNLECDLLRGVEK